MVYEHLINFFTLISTTILSPSSFYIYFE